MLRFSRVACAVAATLVLVPVASAQRRPSLAIPDFTAAGSSGDMAATLGGLVANEVQKLGTFDVMTAEAIRSVLAMERQKQLMGCSSDSCMGEIADALGADYLLNGKLSRLPGAAPVYTLELTLLDARKARRLASDVRTATSEADLSKQIPKSVAKVLAPVTSKLTGLVRLTSSESGATVKVDDRIVGTTPLQGTLSLPAGPHLVAVEKKGFIAFEKELRVEANGTLEETATLSPSPDFIKEYEDGANRSRLLAWSSAGGAVAAGAVAAAFQYLSVQAYGSAAEPGSFLYHRQFLLNGVETDATANHRLEATRLQTDIARSQMIAALCAGVSGAALLTAGGLFLLGDDPGRYARFRRIEVSLAPQPGGVAGVVLVQF